ncbi:MAG: beta strand repeat-containing protein, partial [Verrucomicrobium sp.]
MTITLSNYGGIVDANVGLTLSNNFVIESSGGTLRTYGNATTTLTGAISGDGGINHTDGGVLVLAGDLSGFTGELYNQAGTTALGGSASLKNSSGITVGSASIFSVRRSGVLNASSILPTALIFETFNSNFEMNSADAGAVLNLDFDMGSDWNVGLLRLAGGAVTLKNGTDVVMNSVVMYLKSATNQGTLNIEEGSTLMTTYLNVGAAASQSGVINQTGGTVTLLGGNFGFRLGHFSNGTNPGSTYTLSGGVLDATFLSSNAANTDRMVNVGYDGVGAMTVGGGPGTAELRVYGLQLDVQSPDASMVSTLTLKSRGTIEIGAGGTASGDAADVIIMDGGMLKATAGSTWAAGMTVTATSGSTWDTAGYLVTLAGSVLGSGEVALVDSTGIPGGLTFNPGAGSQIITVGLSGSGTLTKAGSGKTTLAGPGGFVGSMNHSAGTLLIDGNFSALAVNVADGAVFGGEGTIASLVLGTSTGGGLAVDPTTSGALTILGNVTLTGTTRLTFSGGPESFGSPITLFSYGGTLTGLSNLLPGMSNYRNPTVSNVAGVVSVTLGNKSLVWNGASGSQWQVAGGVNRWNAGETDAFYWGDAVRFDDGGAATTVAVTGEVRPAAIAVDNSSKNYTFASSAGNVIAGATSIIKSGTASLTLTGPNTYTGTTTVRQGRVTGTNNTAFGASTIVLGDAGTGSGVLELFLDPMTAGANLTVSNAITVNVVAADVTAVMGTLGSSANQVTRSATFGGAVTLFDDLILRSGAHDATVFSGTITGASGLTISVENGLLAPGNATSTHFGRGQAGNRVTLSGSANTFLGNWVIKSGTASNLTIFQVNIGNRINDSSNVHVEEFAVFRLFSAETINGLTGNGRVRAVNAQVLTVGGGNGSGTFSGILENDTFDAGTLALTKAGNGTQTLTGASTYTAGTTVRQGRLVGTSSTAFGTGTILLGDAGTGSGTLA